MSRVSDRDSALMLRERVKDYSREELVTLRQWTWDIATPEERFVLDDLIRGKRLRVLSGGDSDR